MWHLGADLHFFVAVLIFEGGDEKKDLGSGRI